MYSVQSLKRKSKNGGWKIPVYYGRVIFSNRKHTQTKEKRHVTFLEINASER